LNNPGLINRYRVINWSWPLHLNHKSNYYKCMNYFIKVSSFKAGHFIHVCFLFLLFLTFTADVSAQTQPLINSTLDGTVKDAQSGETLPGALVRIKGTSHQVGTDNAGKFRFVTGQKFPYTLLINFIGYEPVELVANGSPIEVLLKQKPNELGEVVVVGYGTQKKQDLIGSVSQISAEKVNNRQAPQLSNALTGQLPGVTVIQRSGKPGASSGDINVRGVGSFGAGTTPLIIVDGVQSTSFNEIDPNDVASISVLKDASSAAIYGARAANGVILVTTKNGKAGKTKISYNAYAGFQKATALPEFVNSWEFAELYNEASNSQSYTAADITKYKDGTDRDLFPNTNFVDAVLTKNGVQTSHNITASGGNEHNQFNISGGYLFQDGLVVKNNYNKYNLRLNLVNELSPKVTLTTRLSAINSNANEPGTPATLDASGVLGIISSTVRYPAIYAGKLSSGYYGLGVVQKGTPISFLETESFTKTNNQNLTANLRLDYQALPELKLSVVGAYNQLTADQKNFSASQVLNPTLTLGPNQLLINNGNTKYKTLQLLADYSKHIGKHTFGLLAGASHEDSATDSLTASRDKLPGNDLTQINVGAEDNQKNSGTGSEWAIQSLFGRLRYNFDQRYLFEGTIRYDGSSRFPTSTKYAFFPSAAVGWRIGQEKFLKDRFSWFNDLKLRVSYGILGNQNIDNYPYQNTLNTGVNYPFGGQISSGVALTQLTDPNLHWESTRTADVGVDLSLFKGKLNLGATYFDRNTYDILYSPASSVSSVLGFKLSPQNTGKLVNKGFELTLDHVNTIGDFTYNINANLTIVDNKVKDLGVGNVVQPNGLIGNGSTLFIGHPLEMYYGYVADGLFVDEQDIKDWPSLTAINPLAKPGDIRYKDISGPNGVPDGKVDATYDRKVLGSRIPKYSFGLNLGSSYHNFDFNVLLQGVAGVKGTLDSYAGYAFNNFGNVQRWQKDERWTAANPQRNAGYPRLEIISNSGTPNTLPSSFWIINASYLKLKSVQLGYTLPSTVSTKAGLSRARIYLSGENLANLNNYRKGWDPEINTGGNFYPILATYTVGLNVTF
jgi:TonB-linked SusC/RagA family outer membrane protein